MGLFSGPPPEIDAHWEALIIPDGDKQKTRDRLQKAIANSHQGLTELNQRETIAALFSNSWTASEVVAVTSAGVATFLFGKPDKYYRFDEIGKTGIYNLPGTKGCWVDIESWRALRDFHADDHRRRGHVIKVNFDTPGPAQRLCALIDPQIN